MKKCKGSKATIQNSSSQLDNSTCSQHSDVNISAWADLFALLLEMKVDQENITPEEPSHVKEQC